MRPTQLPYVVPGAASAVVRKDTRSAERGEVLSAAALRSRLSCLEIEEHQDCPLCGSTELRVRYRPGRTDSESQEIWSYSVGQCPRCGLFYRVPGIKVDRVPDLYSAGDYTEFLDGDYRKGRKRKYRAALKAFSPLFDAGNGAKLLDMGCGTGAFMTIAKKRGFEAYGTDLSPSAVASSQETHGHGRVTHGGLESVESSDFDVITMWSVLAHIADPHDQMVAVRNLLKPGGSLLISTVNANSLQRKAYGNWWNGFTRNHLMFWEEATLTRLALDCGFSAIRFEPFFGPGIEFGKSNLSPTQVDRYKRAVTQYGAGNMLRAVATK